ncbi:MAG: glycosyltransferase family 25 protein [Gammaproteobacteria bacterium]
MSAPPIVVISLARATERRQAVTAHLGAQQLPFEFMDAIDKRTLSDVERERVVANEYVLNTGREATDGEIACFASHRKAWGLCAQSGAAMVIMEDDFTLATNFSDAIAVASRCIDACGFIRFQSETRAQKKKFKEDGEHTVWRYTKAPHSLAGYMLLPRAAEALIQHSEEFIGPADVYTKMFWLHRQVMYGVSPYSVWDSDFSSASDIGARPKAQKDLLTRLLRPIRKLSHWRQRVVANRAISDAPNIS